MMITMKSRMDRWNCDAGSNHESDDINDNTGIDLPLRGVGGFKQLTEARAEEKHTRDHCNGDGSNIHDVMSL